MKNNKILQALIFAAAILIASLLTKDSDNGFTITMMIVAGWVATGGLSGSKREIDCFKARFKG
jgi:hypothetical protein